MQPWQLLLRGVVGWMDRAQPQAIEDALEENRIPRKQAGQNSLGLALLSAIIALGLAGLPAAAVAKSALSPVDLRCEYLKNPLGIDVSQPELSWRLESATPSSHSQSQTAYQVLVATEQTVLRHDQGDLWDSGKVLADQSLHVAYAGIRSCRNRSAGGECGYGTKPASPPRGANLPVGPWGCSSRRIGRPNGSAWMAGRRRSRRIPTSTGACRRECCAVSSLLSNPLPAPPPTSATRLLRILLNGRQGG